MEEEEFLEMLSGLMSLATMAVQEGGTVRPPWEPALKGKGREGEVEYEGRRGWRWSWRS